MKGNNCYNFLNDELKILPSFHNKKCYLQENALQSINLVITRALTHIHYYLQKLFSFFFFLQRAEGLMIQKWFDPRLIHENRRTGKQPYLNAIHHFDSIWTPGCLQAVCNNGEESRKMSVKALEVFPNGTVCSVSQ